MTPASARLSIFDPQETAGRFVNARRHATALPGYPGRLPANLDEAYACQDAAIALWPDAIVGWKVGRIPPHRVDVFGAERLAGPIFAGNVWPLSPLVSVPLIENGFGAVEAEYVFRLGADTPANKLEWTFAEVQALEGELHIGVEIAGSPLSTINELGPAVVVSDFGNNAGLILGPVIQDWRSRMDELSCETFIEGRSVGKGGAASIPGSPLAAVRFLLENTGRRGRPLKKGDLVSTGAATGIHDFKPGQAARVDFGVDGAIECKGVQAAG
ncbi:MAG: 2-keto-4-pentenoate hydratase [Proteobacteria bacterium]|nr:2-keto-4-pentenoate hydratase [Pseudomonadota bacterium]